MKRLREIKERQVLEEQTSRPDVLLTIEGRPRIYLQAHPEDQTTWITTKKALEEAGCRVVPERLPTVAHNMAAMRRARQDRIGNLRGSHALLVLHARNSAVVERQIEAAVGDLADLQAYFDKDLPCAIVDHVGDLGGLADELDIGTIDATDKGWLVSFHAWLAEALGSSIGGRS